MKVVLAPDAFKECLPAGKVAEALAEGWRRVFPEDDIVCVPMADGGEGTVDALVAATGGRYVSCIVTGPMGDPVTAVYGLLGDGATAIIEMAAASGLPLVPPEQRDLSRATTYGTGELIKHALDAGARRIIIGIGGSATNDGGAGMAAALGYAFLDAEGRSLPAGGAALRRLVRIDSSNRHPALEACEIRVACDVDNPLCGPHGASRVYGPQKGASPDLVDKLDAALCHFGDIIAAQLDQDIAEVPGAGAAGGLGAGLMAFAGGRLSPGVELVAAACGLDETLRDAALVITGEGRMDAQSARGKTPMGVAQAAKRHGVPVVAVAGALGDGYESLYGCGIDAIFPITPRPMPLAEALAQAPRTLADTAEAIARLWRIRPSTNPGIPRL